MSDESSESSSVSSSSRAREDSSRSERSSVGGVVARSLVPVALKGFKDLHKCGDGDDDEYELWLIKVPDHFDRSLLNDMSVPLAPLEEGSQHHVGDKNYAFRPLDRDYVNQVVVFPGAVKATRAMQLVKCTQSPPESVREEALSQYAATLPKRVEPPPLALEKKLPPGAKRPKKKKQKTKK